MGHIWLGTNGGHEHIDALLASGNVQIDRLEDYALLRWVLERSAPQAVTLEYWDERAQLEDQLRRLRTLLDSPL